MPKYSEYTAATEATGDDLLLITNDPAGTPVSKKITITALFGNVSVAVVVNNQLTANTFVLRDKSTPANSTISISGGRIWYDDNYVYVATANNTVKRAALSSF